MKQGLAAKGRHISEREILAIFREKLPDLVLVCDSVVVPKIGTLVDLIKIIL